MRAAKMAKETDDEEAVRSNVPAAQPTLSELIEKRERVIQIIHQLDELKEELSGIAGGLKRGYLFDHYHYRYTKDRIRKTDIAFLEHVIFVYALSNSMTENKEAGTAVRTVLVVIPGKEGG